MVARQAGLRIAVNVVLDAVLAALAVPAADWLTGPNQPALDLFAAPLWGAVALLAAGLPFRLAVQFWRYTGPGELVGVAASAVLAAGLFAAGLHAREVALPSPAFPVGHAMTLFVVLSFPRIGYRMLRETPAAVPTDAVVAEPRPVLLLGAGDAADLFLTALAGDPSPPYRAVGLLSSGEAQTGRRIQGCPVLGSLADAPDAFRRLREQGDQPRTLVITDAALDGAALEPVLRFARDEGLAVAWAPRVTALDPVRPARA